MTMTVRPAGGHSFWSRIGKVAWLSIVLGFAMELLTVGAVTVFGSVPGLKEAVADTIQRVSWGTFVCIGIAAGSTASKARVPAGGIAGVLSAPIAFTIARALHESVARGLALSPQAAGVLSPLLLATVKGCEYGVLGLAISWITNHRQCGIGYYIGFGLLCGVVFGGAVLTLTAALSQNAPPLSKLVSLGINEILFPVGCSIVLYLSHSAGAHFGKTEAFH